MPSAEDVHADFADEAWSLYRPGMLALQDDAPRRKGKWSPEESEYASCIVDHFTNGWLVLPLKYTLREYLSKALHSDPMRITKRFPGTLSIRKVRCHGLLFTQL